MGKDPYNWAYLEHSSWKGTSRSDSIRLHHHAAPRGGFVLAEKAHSHLAAIPMDTLDSDFERDVNVLDTLHELRGKQYFNVWANDN